MYADEGISGMRPEPPMADFKIEAVIVCDRYHDFLRYTLPTNKCVFDKMVVVTSAEDHETQRICEFYGVEVAATDKLQSRWKKFCKGAGINEGLGRLDKDGWVVHMDADIWLPPQSRLLLEESNLDRHLIYGIDRFKVAGYAAWQKFLEKPQLQHEASAYIHLDAFPLYTRFMSPRANGYVPVGYFQMWFPKQSGIYRYPEGHTTAGREDMLFALAWPRQRRALIPEVVAYHLESEAAGLGTNWAGRKSAVFGPQ